MLPIGWLRLRITSSPPFLAPLASQQPKHTHCLFSLFPINQPPLDTLKEGFSELVTLMLGFRKILLRPDFTSWLNRTRFALRPSAVDCPTRCVRPTPFKDSQIGDGMLASTTLLKSLNMLPQYVSSYATQRWERKVNQKAKQDCLGTCQRRQTGKVKSKGICCGLNYVSPFLPTLPSS